MLGAASLRPDDRCNLSSNGFDYRGYDRIPKLPICLGIGDNDWKAITKPEALRDLLAIAHESSALLRCQATRPATAPLDKDLGAVFVVARTECPRHVVRPNQPETKAIACFAVLLRICP